MGVRKVLWEVRFPRPLPTFSVETGTHIDIIHNLAVTESQPATNGRREGKRYSVVHLCKLDKAANYGDQKRVVGDNDIIML